MVGIFKANNSFNTFILFVYGLLLKLPFFLHPYKPELQQADGSLYKGLLAILKIPGEIFPVIYPAVAYFFLFTQAAMFNRLVNDKRLIQRPNYLPGMSYMLITSLFVEWSYLSSPLVINSFLIWIWAKITNLTTASQPKTTLFNIGIITGLASFIYFPSIAFSLLIGFGLVLNRPFKPAEWVITCVGIITPYYFLFAFLFLTNHIEKFRIPQFAFLYPSIIRNYWTFSAVLLLVFAFLTGCYFIQLNFRRQLVLSRKSWSLLLLYLGIAIILALINNTNTLQIWVLTAIPISAVIACAFYYPGKRWFPLTLHWLMVLLIFVITYFIS